MVLKLIKTNYSYECILSLANKDVMMKDIEDEINESFKEFNIYARTSTKNKKRISSCKIDEDEDLLIIILDSENPLPIPVRGLKYFTQLLIERLDGEDGKKDKDGVLLLDKICKKKSFFRTVSVREIKNSDKSKLEERRETQKLISSNNDEKAENNINILTNDLHGTEEKNEIQRSNINFSKLKNLMNELELVKEQEKRIIDAINEELKGGDE